MLAWVRRRPIAVLLGGALLLLLGPGCHILFPFSPGETGNSAKCTVEVWQCGLTAGQAKVDHPAGSPFQVVEGLKADKATTYSPYYNSKITIKAAHPMVRGSTLLQTGAGDWKVSSADFMTVRVLTEVEGLYVAYDARVTTPPSWLTATGPSGYTRQAGSLTLSIKNPATGEDLRLDLWKRNTPPGSDPIVIPGAAFGNPTFANLAPGSSPLMYVVLVQPKQVTDCSHASRLADHTFAGCAGGDQTQAALADCQAQRADPVKDPGKVCRSPSCAPLGSACPLQQGLRSYQAASLVEFYATPQTVLGIPVAASQAQVTVGGSTSSAEASGSLYFSNEGDLQLLTIHDLALDAGTVSTDAGQFADTKLSLWDTATAECTSGVPPFGQPCDDYRIPAAELQVNVSSVVDGQVGLWQGENAQPVSVHLNQATRSFDFSGTVLVTVETSRGPVDLTAGLNLHGFIMRVEPQAVAGLESRLTAECVEDRNADPVTLSAAGSFQVYAPSPQNLARFEWWEDFGLVTEHQWGTTRDVTIPPGALAFGSHEITLLVADAGGLLDTDTVEAAVVDTVPPEFTTVPLDITTDVYARGTERVQVELGTYSARDACNPYVEVTNDAPEGSWFTPGTHTVTWRADDLRGNVTEATQTVRVRVLGSAFPWWWVVGGAAGLVLVGGLGWLGVRARKRSGARPAGDATPAPPPPGGAAPAAAAGPATVWLAAGAAIMLVAAGAVAAVLLVNRGDGPDQGISASTTGGAVTTSSQFQTTSSSPGATTIPETSTTLPGTTVPETSVPETTVPETTVPETTVPETTVPETTVPGTGLDPNGPATYGEVKLVQGFLTDPALYPITAGGPIDLAAALPGQGCAGFAATNPDLRFEWEGQGGLLRFYFIASSDPDTPAADTVLAIRDPGGGWHCNDDSWATPHPAISIDPSQRGYYEIWVGTYSAGQYPAGTLYVTELDTNHP